jgi:hypothetical protein
VLKLLQLSIEEFDHVLRALNRERKERLLELALRNGFEKMENFREHVKHLRG